MNAEHLEICGSEGWRDALRDLILPYALADARLGDDVLEVGPGPGMTTDLLRPEVAQLTAVELDEDLAAALEARLEGTNVEVVNADATAMPFEDGRFTGAVSFTMLHHVPTAELQDRLFAEVARVLRPGALTAARAKHLKHGKITKLAYRCLYLNHGSVSLWGCWIRSGWSRRSLRSERACPRIGCGRTSARRCR